MISTKIAGGPGSGLPDADIKYIVRDFKGLALSPIISIGKRRVFMSKNLSTEKEIPLKKVRYVCQEKYRPSKVNRIMKIEAALNKPIDVLKDSNGEFTILDGHHRFLAIKKLGKEKLKANVFDGKDLEKNVD